jgi:DNA-binding transcriptional ArsR family regulator
MDELQHRLSVIAEPTRFRIVELLKTGPRSVGAIVEALGVGQPQVSRHLRLLADAGVVEVTPRAQQRIYRLRPEPMRDIGAWAQSFATLWSGRLDRLGDFLTGDPEHTDEKGASS